MIDLVNSIILFIRKEVTREKENTNEREKEEEEEEEHVH